MPALHSSPTMNRGLALITQASQAKPAPLRSWLDVHGVNNGARLLGNILWRSRTTSISRNPSRPVCSSSAPAPAAAIDPNAHRVIDTELQSEAQKSYLAYAMSVIVGRALPDVRDGLKPVHRRILYAMHDLGLTANKPHRKCARVVGEVLGKYHPHGDTAVYNALVRLAQDFSMQETLISGHGNFGSVDNDPAAAMRYTECRLQQISSAMLLADLDSSTIKFAPNFDESQEEPTVLPAKVPHLLVNGSSGIAVGIATNIPPHNLREVVSGLRALIADPAITVRQLMDHIPAPDFPTGGEILQSEGGTKAYHDGRGSVVVRGKAAIEVEEDSGKAKKGKSSKTASLIVITELPYQTNKSSLVISIAELVDKGVITGVSDVRDESDRNGMRVVVEVKKGASPEVLLNNLYKHTTLQGRFSCNMVALVDGQPKSLDLKAFLTHFLDFRCEVVRKRADRDLLKALTRQHLVEGFLIAMSDLDKVVATIRKAADGPTAAKALQDAFGLSDGQTEGVLSLSLRRLTGLEAKKLSDEAEELQSRVGDLRDLLQSQERVLQMVESEAQEIADKFGRPRRSEICEESNVAGYLDEMSVTPNDACFVMFSQKGFIKRLSSDNFAVQGRGGRGSKGATLREDDSMSDVIHLMAHDDVLFFTQAGSVHSIKAFKIPEASRTAAGSAITQVLPIGKSDTVAAMMVVSKYADDEFVVTLTEGGLVKKSPLSQFSNIRANGINAIKLLAGDRVMAVGRCKSGDTLLLATSSGHALRFKSDDLKSTSRSSKGSKSMKVHKGAEAVGMAVLPEALSSTEEGPWILITTEQGFGKRLDLEQVPIRSRNRVGVIVTKLRDNDRLVDISFVGRSSGNEAAEIIFVSAKGLISRNLLSSISIQRRTALGTSVLNLQEGDRLLTVTPIKTPPLPVSKAPGSTPDPKTKQAAAVQ